VSIERVCAFSWAKRGSYFWAARTLLLEDGTRGSVCHPLNMVAKRIQPNRCKHKWFGNIVPIVGVRVQHGYSARCLLCDAIGPVRDNAENARLALLASRDRDEE
jgi:hypothetical protein